MTRNASRARPCARTPFAASATPLLAPVALAVLAVSAPAFAQAADTAATRLDEVTVTSTRSPLRLSEVLSDVTVINRDDIEKQGYGNLPDLLRNAAAIEITRNGGPGANSSVFIRGAESRHTVVLLDGVRVDSQSTGGADWQNIPLSQIERVEVLKGPASALYGSDAIGGVVQIFTRRGNGRTQVDLGVGAGNLGQARADASITGGTKRFDYAATLAGERGTGFNNYLNTKSSSYNADKDGWRNYSASLRLGAELVEGQRLEFSGLKSRTNAGYDAGSKADDRSITTTEAARLGWNSQWTKAFSTETAVAQSSSELEYKPSSPYLSKTRIRTATVQGFYKLSEHQQINGLLERREDRLDNSSLVNGGEDTRSENAVGLSYLLTAGPFSLQVHGRHDDDSEFGGINTGTLAAGYKLGAGWRLTGSVGNAFRAPTLYQRGSIYGPDLSIAGVEALRPERGHSQELGLAWSRGSLDFAITTYHNKVSDLIAFGSAGTCQSTYGCYGNISRATLQGTSLKGGAQLGWVHLSANVDFSDPTDDSNGKTLARRAKRFGTLRADTQWANWTFGTSLQGTGKRWDNATNTTRLGGYGLVNVDAQYAFAKDWKVQLNVDNLLDHNYQTANYYAQAGRTWMLTLRYSPSF